MIEAIDKIFVALETSAFSGTLFLLVIWIFSYKLCAKHLKRRDGIPLKSFLENGGLEPFYTSTIKSTLDTLDRWFLPREATQQFFNRPFRVISVNWNWVLYDRVLIFAILYPTIIPLIAWIFAGSTSSISGITLFDGNAPWSERVFFALAIASLIFITFVLKYLHETVDRRIVEYPIIFVSLISLLFIGIEQTTVILTITVCAIAASIGAFKDDYAHGEPKSHIYVLVLGLILASGPIESITPKSAWIIAIFVSLIALFVTGFRPKLEEETTDFALFLPNPTSDKFGSPATENSEKETIYIKPSKPKQLEFYGYIISYMAVFLFLTSVTLGILSSTGLMGVFPTFNWGASILTTSYCIYLIFHRIYLGSFNENQILKFTSTIGVSFLFFFALIYTLINWNIEFTHKNIVLLLFFGLFPIANAISDFFSIGLTRWCLRHSLQTNKIFGLPSLFRPAIFNLLDLVGAIASRHCQVI